MSWSFSIPATTVGEFAAAADAARAAAQANIEQSNPTGADQADEAVKAAKAMVASGTVGGADAKVGASLSGHGNPDHKPAAGWSNDSFSVSVYQQ